VPLRALLSIPLGCAAVGAFELAAVQPRLGFGAARLLHAVLGTALAGAWAAVLAALVALLLARTGRSADRIFDALQSPTSAGAFSVAFVAAAAAARLVPAIVLGLEDHTLDFVEVSAQIGTFVALCAVAALVPACVWTARFAARRLDRRRARLLARLAMTAVAAEVLQAAAAGPFVLKFGLVLAPALAAGAALVAAVWLPGRVRPTRRRLAGLAAGVAAYLAAGLSAHRDDRTRAAMLHETRIVPGIVDLGLGVFDRDGDGALPAWLGGPDCDDTNPLVAQHRFEIPGNGLDDNCHGGDAPPRREVEVGPSPAGPRPHVVLVTIDALGAYALSDFGAPFDTMPNLEARARRGRWYRRAYAPANHTFFSMVALLSGQRPERLRIGPHTQHVRFSFWLPHRMRQLGYRTVAVQPPLLGDHLPFSELRFDELYIGPWDYDARNRGGTARQRVDLVDHLFDDGPPDRPMFLWIHLYDAHALHEAHERFPGSGTKNAYYEELFWIDLQLARLFAVLDEHLGDDKILVVTSDHGETFGERGAYGHGHGLHETEIHVPLLLEGPGIEPARVEAPYPTGGLVATLLALLGQPPEPAMLSYGSLLDPPPPAVVVENPFTGDERRYDAAVVTADDKLLVHRTRGTSLYVDLRSDPHERHPLADPAPPDRLAALEALLWRTLDHARPGPGDATP